MAESLPKITVHGVGSLEAWRATAEPDERIVGMAADAELLERTCAQLGRRDVVASWLVVRAEAAEAQREQDRREQVLTDLRKQRDAMTENPAAGAARQLAESGDRIAAAEQAVTLAREATAALDTAAMKAHWGLTWLGESVADQTVAAALAETDAAYTDAVAELTAALTPILKAKATALATAAAAKIRANHLKVAYPPVDRARLGGRALDALGESAPADGPVLRAVG